MSNSKNIWLSFLYFTAAPLWFLLVIGGMNLLDRVTPSSFTIPYWTSSILMIIVGLVYFGLFGMGMIFGLKNLRSKNPSMLGNLITLFGTLGLLFSLYLFVLMSAF